VNIKFIVTHLVSPRPLIVDVNISVDKQILFHKTINLQNTIEIIDASFSLLTLNQQNIIVSFNTNDFSILTNQLIIKNIILDNFYSSPKVTHSASRQFSNEFLSYSKEKKIFLDLDVNDNDTLNFTGSLVYNFVWPFFKNTHI
jgi:hypothetical protein